MHLDASISVGFDFEVSQNIGVRWATPLPQLVGDTPKSLRLPVRQFSPKEPFIWPVLITIKDVNSVVKMVWVKQYLFDINGEERLVCCLLPTVYLLCFDTRATTAGISQTL